MYRTKSLFHAQKTSQNHAPYSTTLASSSAHKKHISYHQRSMSKTKKSAPPQFETKEYDVSPSILCWIVCCPCTCAAVPYSIILNLGPEEG
jgi:hypothetical protein